MEDSWKKVLKLLEQVKEQEEKNQKLLEEAIKEVENFK